MIAPEPFRRETGLRPSSLAMQASINKDLLHVAFCCQADNDLYRVMTADEKQ